MKTTIEDAEEKKQFKPIAVNFVIENEKDAGVMYKFMQKHRCVAPNLWSAFADKLYDMGINCDKWYTNKTNTHY